MSLRACCISKTLGGFSTNNGIRIKISVPNLDGISTNGAGTIDVSRLKNDKFDIDSNGAASIRVSGETNALRIEANGAGKIDTHKLRATKAVVESTGVSRVELHASDRLDVTVSGPSQVIYEGDPEVYQSIDGPGSVQKKPSGA
jgi:Putative auto-transporter adhesin, head GIN domain